MTHARPSRPSPLQILIADHHPIVRTGLMKILSQVDGFEVVGEVGDEKQLLAWLRARAADLLVMDLSMPGDLFLQVLGQIRTSYPSTQVVILAPEPENPYVIRSLHLGAAGCLSKACTPAELIDAIETIARGGRHASSQRSPVINDGAKTTTNTPAREMLSDRELQVLRLLGSGNRVRDTAREMGISPKTVSTYRTRLLRKLGLRTTADLIRFAVEHGVMSWFVLLGSGV